MTSIGIRVYGIATKVDDNHIPQPDKYYETTNTLNNSVPAGQELDFLQYVKQKIESEEHVRVNYASVEGNKLTVQWRSLGSPIAVSTIVALIIIVIGLFALASVLHETYMISTILGAETIGSIVQLIALIFICSFFSTMLSTVTGIIPKRKRE